MMPHRSRIIRTALSTALFTGVLAAACAPPKIRVKAPASVASIEAQKAPDFTATDHRGQRVALADAGENTISVLVFYRGAW